MSLPSHISMTPGYCLLTPYEHISSTTRLDEDAIKEIRHFKCQLTVMFEEQYSQSGCVFIETASKSDTIRHHAQVECIPVPKKLYSSLPAYFKVIYMYIIFIYCWKLIIWRIVLFIED